MSNLFTRDIGGRCFNFQPYNFGHEAGYHVDVKDADGNQWEFRMAKPGDESWQLHGQNLPGWILELEHEIIKGIKEHE